MQFAGQALALVQNDGFVVCCLQLALYMPPAQRAADHGGGSALQQKFLFIPFARRIIVVKADISPPL